MDNIGKIFIETANQFRDSFKKLFELRGKISQINAVKAIPTPYLAFALLKGQNVPIVNVGELKSLQEEFDALAPECRELENDLDFVAQLVEANRARFNLGLSGEVQTIYNDFLAARALLRANESQ